MRSKLSDLKSLYTTLGGESTDVLNANSEIAVLNGILALGSVDSSKFIPDAIKAIADNFALIDPSPAATLIEKTVTANGTYSATSDSANGYSQVNVAVPSADLMEKTIENILPPGVYPEQYDPAEDEADGYSLVTLTAPSAEEIAAEWIKIDLTVNVSNKTVTIDSTSEELTAAFETKQTDEPRFYVNITTII